MEDCGSLVRSWCHKMQYLYGVEASSGLGIAFVFSANDLASCEEPTELTSMADRVGPKSEDMKRIIQIRQIRC